MTVYETKRFEDLQIPEGLHRAFISNGEALLEKLMELGGCAVVLTDQDMGDGMSGTELIREIRNQKLSCKAYIVSNFLKSVFEKEALNSGADGYIKTPIEKKDLIRCV